jgi:type II secretory pathway pseudopilin PulG
MRFLKSTKKGFTLLETVVYLAIFGVVFITMVQFSFAMGTFSKRNEENILVERNTIFINEHIDSQFKIIQSIDANNSIFNNASGRLNIVTQNGAVSYYIQNNQLFVAVGGNNYTLSTAGSEVTNFYLERVKSIKTGNLIGARLNMTLRSKSNPTITKVTQTSFIIN